SEIYNLNQEHFEIIEPDEPNNPFLAMKEQKFAESKKKSPEITLASISQTNKEIEDFFDKTKDTFSDSFKPLFNALKKAIENSSNYNEAIRNILSLTYTNDDNKIEEIARNFLIADLLGRKSAQIKGDVKKFADDFSNFDINNLKMKVPMTKDKFNELSDKYKNYAFTVKGYEEEGQVKDILEHLISVKERGLGFKEWQKEALEKGFEVSSGVYWQNIKAGQMAGRYNEMMEYIDIAPYWQYVAVVDKNTDPKDLAINGTIRRYDDPFWNEWYPPNHFGCRCSLRALTKEYLEKKGYDVEKIDKSSGIPTKDEALKNISKIQDEAKEEETDFALGLYDVKNKIREMSGKTNEINMMPQNGFDNNVGKSLFDWVRIKEKINANSNWLAISKDKINFKNELKDTEATKIELIDKKNKTPEELKKEAREYLEKILVDNKIIFDKNDKPIFIDVSKFIEHLVKTDKNGEIILDRFKYLKVIPEIIKNPDLITQNVYVMPKSHTDSKGKKTSLNKKGMVKISKSYIKKIVNENGKETFLNFVINSTKEYPDYNGWTFYETTENNGVVSYKR
ncbi:MAG TPA: phage minor head protein, partial [Spirochaetota bacterium]|nr:phage minor head protein [Spirochaetota bacterium]